MKDFWLSTTVALVALAASLAFGAATPEPAQAQLCQVLNNCPPPPAQNKITVRVDADPDGPTDFAYSGSHTAIGEFVLDDDGDAAVPAARTFTVPDGTYTVTQGAPPGGYEMRAIQCTDPTGNSTGNVANRAATINASGSETVECTFKNAQPLTVRCPEGTVPNERGECVISDERVVCPQGTVPNGQGQCVINDGRVVCPQDSTRNAQGQCVVNSVVCPSGTTRNDQGQCVVDGEHAVCPQGSTKNAQGQCVVTDDRVQCPAGSTRNSQGQCVVTDDRVQCPAGSTKNAQGQCIANEAQCPTGSARNTQGECVVTDVQCPQGTTRTDRGECVVNNVVCPEGTTRNAQGQCVVDGEHTVCPQGSARNAQGECVVTDDRVQCPAGSVRNAAGQCVVTDDRVQCPPGSTKNAQGQCVVNEVQCPAGSARNSQGQCVVTDVQCPAGSTKNAQGQCVVDGQHTVCPQGSARDAQGQCVVSDDRVQCPEGSSKNSQGQCVVNEARCPDGTVSNAQSECVISDDRVVCPTGTTRNAQGQCVVNGEHTVCPAGSTRNAQGQCVVTDDRVQCPQGSTRNAQGQCVVDEVSCPQGTVRNPQGQCVINDDRVVCPQGTTRNDRGECVEGSVVCPEGTTRNDQGQCVVDGEHAVCPQGSTKNAQGQCVVTDDRVQCPQGSVRNAQGQCVVTDDRVQCPQGSAKNAEGQCVVNESACPAGESANGQGECVAPQGPPPTSSPPAAQDPPATTNPLPAGPPEQQRPSDGASEPVADDAGAAPLVTVARRIAPPWAQFQMDSGLFRNPLTGVESPGGYGPAMIGHGLAREGLRAGDGSMLASGIRAITATVSRSSGVEENPLQLLAVASAYNWARRNLGSAPAFDADRAVWERYLATWKSAGVGPGARRCFESPTCFHSYDLIDAVATLELFATGLQAGMPDARLADAGARSRAIAVLGQEAYRAIGREARTLGQHGRLYRLGILSDSPANPLAYHALSIAALARGISLLGDEAPAEARIALKRAIDATSSFVGPDGDVAYIGRAHGAVWALGATVYAAHVCARSFTAFARSTGRRCDTLAGRTLDRIVREHDFGNVGLNAIPRFRTSGLDDRGLDPYANLISSAGLTAVFLEWAADERRGRPVPPETPVPLPLEGGGAFVEPAATRFAVMRRGPTWFAVHLEPTSLRDPRYDFGLMSLKARGADRRWTDVLPPRPLPLPGAGNGSAGPVLMRGGTVAYPAGTRMSVDRGTGTITIHGGWRTRSGRWLRRGVAFRYRAIRGGVRLTFPVQEDDRITVADFVPATGRSAISGRAIRARGFTSTLSPPGRGIARKPGWSSAYDASLVRVSRTLDARDDGTVSWTIAAR